MKNQKILDILNSLSVIEKQGGEDAYILIRNNNENEGDILLEPFSGSESLAHACKELNRNFIAFELDKEYYIKACERIGQQVKIHNLSPSL